jgi:hypothetical protein
MDDRPRARRDPGARSSRAAAHENARGAPHAHNGGSDRPPRGFASLRGWRQAADSERGDQQGGDLRAEEQRPGPSAIGTPPRQNGGRGGLLSGWGGGTPGGRGGPRVSGAPNGGGPGGGQGAGYGGANAPGDGSRAPRVEPEDRRNSWSGRTGARSGPAKPTWSRWEDRESEPRHAWTDASAATPAWNDQSGQSVAWPAGQSSWTAEREPAWSTWDDDPRAAAGDWGGGASAWPGQADFAEPRGGSRSPGRGGAFGGGSGRSGGGRLAGIRRG